MNIILWKAHLKLWFVGVALVLLVLCQQSAEAQATNTFPSTGSAGIGTTSPTAPLTISTAGNTLDGTYYSTMTVRKTGDTFSGIRFDKNSTALFRLGTDASNNFQIGRFAGTGAPDDGAFYLNQSGYVGIGTTSPGGPIDIRDNLGRQIIWNQANSGHTFVSANGGNAHVSGNLFFNGSDWNRINTAAAGGMWWAGNDGTLAVLQTGSGSNPVSAFNRPFFINTSGNVGISTTAPNYSLDVNGGTNAFRTKTSTSSANDTIATFESSSGIQAIVRANGYIGIGVTSPSQKLQIGSNTPTGSGAPDAISLGASYSTTARANPKLRLFDDNGSSLYGLGISDHQMDFMVPSAARYVWSVNGVEKMRLDDSGSITVAGNIAAKYQDVAEWVESSQTLAPGTVVVLDHTKSNQVVASSQAYDTRVAGVISLQPGITLGENSAGKVLVATTGRVKVKVDATAGPIQVGDLLVTGDKEGMAKKSEPLSLGGVQIHRPGTLIGKALEPLAQGQGEILVLLSLQ